MLDEKEHMESYITQSTLKLQEIINFHNFIFTASDENTCKRLAILQKH